MHSNISIIITAAGSSTRMGGGIKKEYLPFKNGTVLSSCAKTFLNTCLNNNYRITDFIITCPAGGIEDCKKNLESDKEFNDILTVYQKKFDLVPLYVEGSDTRQKSVFNGLNAIKNNPDIVLIHDGARPFVTSQIIVDTITAAKEYGASVPGVTPTDTQKEIDEKGFIVKHLQRSMLTAVQTPQTFNYEKLLEAHKKAIVDNKEYTDDTEIWGTYIGQVRVVAGDVNNIKITYPEDLKKL